MKRNYEISMIAQVGVDLINETVEVEVDLVGLASDLKYDTDHREDDVTERAKEIIEGYMSESLEHHTMRHVMSRQD